jgi:hypothetical protein
MITVPQLDPVQHLDPTDVIIITHANGTSEKITGADFLKGVTPVDNITASDMHPVTSNAVAAIAPVDTVAKNNLHSVTSGGVYSELHKIKARTPVTIIQGQMHNVEKLYDVEYEGGLHHVSGLYIFPTTQGANADLFKTAKPLSAVADANYMWTFLISTYNAKAYTCLVKSGGTIAYWGSIAFPETDQCVVDFWYKDNTVTQ